MALEAWRTCPGSTPSSSAARAMACVWALATPAAPLMLGRYCSRTRSWWLEKRRGEWRRGAACRVEEAVVVGLLLLRDGRRGLRIEEGEVVIEHPLRLALPDPALHVEEEGGISHLVTAEGAEHTDQEVRCGDAVERRPVGG